MFIHPCAAKQNDRLTENQNGAAFWDAIAKGTLKPQGFLLLDGHPPCVEDTSTAQSPDPQTNLYVFCLAMRSNLSLDYRTNDWLLRSHCADSIFLGFAGIPHLSSQRRVHSVVNMGRVAKTLRRSNSLSRSVSSTAGSFGHLTAIALTLPVSAPLLQHVLVSSNPTHPNDLWIFFASNIPSSTQILPN